jgi:lysophospholipase L1-like esterase
VTCTVTDNIGRQSQCAFSVTLTPLRLSVTKFVAFGDSLTEGENGRPPRLTPGFIDFPHTYPAKLQELLEREYPGQGIVVANRGISGEPVEDGVRRLPSVLVDERAGALLLLHGYNELFGNCPAHDAGSGECSTAIRSVVAKLRECIQIARSPAYGVRYILVSTMTPPGPVIAARGRRIAPEAIVQTNERLSRMVREEGAVLVDPYPQFVGHESEYVDEDGLHLRPAGYQVLAEAFFTAIRTTVPAELPAASLR